MTDCVRGISACNALPNPRRLLTRSAALLLQTVAFMHRKKGTAGPLRVLQLGLGAGTVPTHLRYEHGVMVDVVEINSDIVDAAVSRPYDIFIFSVLDHFSRIPRLCATPTHALCVCPALLGAHGSRMLIGACTPMVAGFPSAGPAFRLRARPGCGNFDIVLGNFSTPPHTHTHHHTTTHAHAV